MLSWNNPSYSKLTLSRWLASNKGLNGEGDFPKFYILFSYLTCCSDFLEHLYYQIKDAPLELFNVSPSPIMQGLLSRKSNLKDIPMWCVLTPTLLQFFKAPDCKDSLLGSVNVTSLIFKKTGERTISIQCGDNMKPIFLIAKTTYCLESWMRALSFVTYSVRASIAKPGTSRLSSPNLWLREPQEPRSLQKSSSTTTISLMQMDQEVAATPAKQPSTHNLEEIRAESHKHSFSASDKEDILANLSIAPTEVTPRKHRHHHDHSVDSPADDSLSPWKSRHRSPLADQIDIQSESTSAASRENTIDSGANYSSHSAVQDS